MERFINPAASDDYANLHSQQYHRAMEQERLARKCAPDRESPFGSLVEGIGRGVKRRFAYVVAGVVVIVMLISRIFTAALDIGGRFHSSNRVR